MSNKWIGIVGSRRRNSEADFDACSYVFRSIYQPGDRIVSGGCPEGGDAFAERIAKAYAIPILIYHPNWKKFGKAAGCVRNSDIAKDADVLIACVAADRTGGTEDTIKKFSRSGKTDLYLV